MQIQSAPRFFPNFQSSRDLHVFVIIKQKENYTWLQGINTWWFSFPDFAVIPLPRCSELISSLRRLVFQ